MACGVSGLIISAVLWVKFDPRTLVQRLIEVEAQQPRYHQELLAWTVATERMLDECGIKLAKAHQRKGGRPAREGPVAAPPLPMDRKALLREVEGKLRSRGQMR